MAKTEAKKGGAFDRIKEAVKGVLESTLVAQLKEGTKFLVEELIHKGQDIAYYTEKKMIAQFNASVMMLFGIIMIFLAITFFLTDFLKLERYWSFLIVGLFLLVISLFLKKSLEKTKYYSFGGK